MKRIIMKMMNCNVSYKRIAPILFCIRRKTIIEAKFLLNLTKNKFSRNILGKLNYFNDKDIIDQAYTGTGYQKNKLIKVLGLSHGQRHRQTGRRCNIFFHVTQEETV